MSSERILIVEDDDGLRDLLVEEAGDAGYEVADAHSAEAALQKLDAASFDLIVSDLRLPGANGMDLLEHTRQDEHPPAFIVITGFGSIPQAVEALKSGADDFLTKPLDLDHFMLAIERSLERRQLQLRVQRFEALLGDEDFHGMVGNSNVMTTLYGQIQRVAQGEGPVLIVGESGTGKELVARSIHEESPRSEEAFVAVNCAGVPRELLESEFFGHKKGAFTGAQSEREGLFVEADGGTLLLDEIAEMPADLQAKLLRVLQEGKVRMVGENEPREVDVRILAATNQDLQKEVKEGSFRTDLYYRLETFTLEIPPLRERGEDIDLLAAHFLERFAAQQDKSVTGLSADAAEMLRHYSFPGNVRELINIIERAVTFCDGDKITVDDFPRRVSEAASSNSHDGIMLDPMLSAEEELITLEELQRRYIKQVLNRVDGNKRKAASILGIGRRTLYRRLEDMEEIAE